MRDRETIYFVYKYITPTSPEAVEPSYYLIRSFDNLGPIESEIMNGLFSEYFPEEKISMAPYLGPFPNLSALNKFSFALVEKLNATRACLLSLTDFNSLLDCVGSIAELGENMVEVGSVIDNIAKSEKKKSIFSKILG